MCLRLDWRIYSGMALPPFPDINKMNQNTELMFFSIYKEEEDQPAI
jgi:hypothetical protein